MGEKVKCLERAASYKIYVFYHLTFTFWGKRESHFKFYKHLIFSYFVNTYKFFISELSA